MSYMVERQVRMETDYGGLGPMWLPRMAVSLFEPIENKGGWAHF